MESAQVVPAGLTDIFLWQAPPPPPTPDQHIHVRPRPALKSRNQGNEPITRRVNQWSCFWRQGDESRRKQRRRYTPKRRASPSPPAAELLTRCLVCFAFVCFFSRVDASLESAICQLRKRATCINHVHVILCFPLNVFSIVSHSFFNGTQISFPYIVVAHLSNSNNDGDNDIAKRVISPLSPREPKSEKPSGTRDVSQEQN